MGLFFLWPEHSTSTSVAWDWVGYFFWLFVCLFVSHSCHLLNLGIMITAKSLFLLGMNCLPSSTSPTWLYTTDVYFGGYMESTMHLMYKWCYLRDSLNFCVQRESKKAGLGMRSGEPFLYLQIISYSFISRFSHKSPHKELRSALDMMFFRGVS